MLYVAVNDIARCIVTNCVRVDASFWTTKADFDAGRAPRRRDDFFMQRVVLVQQTLRRITTNREGERKRLDGRFVNPNGITEADDAIGWEHETRDVTEKDITDEIKDTLRKHGLTIERVGLRGDVRMTVTTVVDDSSDLTKSRALLGFRGYL